MHYYLYKITNTINQKIYIGVHSTSNLEDGYMGSGKLIKIAINKYGIENFEKEILESFDNSEDMFNAEKLLVDKEFISRKDTYNIKIGGEGQWNHINDLPMTDKRRKAISDGIKLAFIEGRWIPSKIGNNSFLGKKHTKESREKISKNNAMKLSNGEYDRRISLYKTLDFSKRGTLGKFATELGISHTQARRFINKI